MLVYQHEGRQPWALRFYASGLVKEYSDSEMEFRGGEFVTRPIPLAWRKTAQLTPEELQQVIDTIRAVDFFQLPDRIGGPRPVDGMEFVWTACLDGQKKTVRAVGPQATDHPALYRLRVLVQEVLAQAAQRDSRQA